MVCENLQVFDKIQKLLELQTYRFRKSKI